MTPKYFHIMPWSRKPYATSLAATQMAQVGESPTTFTGCLTFDIGDDGSAWHDVLMASPAIILFSESVKRAVEAEGLIGATFVEAPIVEVLSSALKKKPMPTYYRLLAEGRVEVDPSVSRPPRRRIPVDARRPADCDFFHVSYPEGPRGYYCSLRALETFRRQKLKNLCITPLDYFEDPCGPLAPPFRIKLNERKWPPKAWYPEGFVPHPNNLIEE